MGTEHVWYFAYGANMAERVFVEARGMRPLSVEAARVDGYRLTFDEPGLPLLEPAFASIEPDPDATVHGALYRLCSADLRRLHKTESANYMTFELDVDGERSGRVRATAYRSRHPVPGLRPSRRYLRLICDGARELGLPAEYCGFLQEQPSVHVPLLSDVFARGIRFYIWLRERGVRPEVLLPHLRALYARWRRL